jgi:hypothetical protein
MTKRKSLLDKIVSGQRRTAERTVRKAITGSGDSLNTQTKRSLRKSLTGSTRRLGCLGLAVPLLLIAAVVFHMRA